MLSLAQEIPEELTARNTENKKEHFNRPFCCTLSKYPVLAILQQLREWDKDWLGRALLGFSWSGSWLSLGPRPWALASAPALLGWLEHGEAAPHQGRACSCHLWPPATLAQPLGQNGIVLEGIGKKHLCPAEHNSGQKMSCSKSCSSSDQILWNLPAKHWFWSFSCSGLHKS